MLGRMINNPLNIKYTPLYTWKGSCGKVNGFVRFETLDYGFRAAILLIRTYVRNDFTYIRDIIRRFAPPSENPTDNYIKYVLSRTDIPNNKISTISDVCQLLAAMARFESLTEVTPDYIYTVFKKFKINESNYFVKPSKFKNK